VTSCYRWILGGLLLLALGARAGEPGLQLVGEAHLKFLFWPIYHSQLYSADGSYQAGQRPLQLDIHYQRSIAAGDLVTRTGLEWETQGLAHPQQQQWLQRLRELWPDVDNGDVLTLAVGPDDVSRFYLNGELLGHMDDPAFTRSFLDIWLSPNTSRPELRLALIGQADS
jgi:hypothetical protein